MNRSTSVITLDSCADRTRRHAEVRECRRFGQRDQWNGRGRASDHAGEGTESSTRMKRRLQQRAADMFGTAGTASREPPVGIGLPARIGPLAPGE
ncbi:hypothetical protein [Burkholderia glumae]|uniref:Uncharacterized protein n=1 Tax=Burkholderia glumae TaxID=337 RepID=A0AAP9XYQ4_BURGL|nr:hypothetical protein [Burkholderia glumae]MCM2485267.1 hypothetical protein [Burkholderia glumae]MCM2510962.1 hypothetical protein [Burkholderia glumae]MCM2540790.1 hypothetical protein [Burkholderia glumae]MCQ0034062.1 hypothetical protein [Burkholderia glumae]MCQ0037948.1 hypothetical protein [Burkholderia glumae]